MKKSEYYSSLIEDLRNKLNILQEKIELLRKYNVENIIEFINQESKLKDEISDLEIKKNAITEEDKNEIMDENFKRKENPFYSRAEYASISGDTVGDPLKDTSGPSLNILIKLSSILSVVFSPLFLSTSFFVTNA
jgi:hypothetical protein